MKLYTYIVTADAGFSPNPFHGVCTLACCKPVIRKTCAVGDWIAGLTSKENGHKVVFALQVGEKILFKTYWADTRFQKKRVNGSTHIGQCGDNIYEWLPDDKWRQHLSLHTAEDMPRDLSGKYVLAAQNFVYYGSKAVSLPEPLASALPVGRGYRCKFRPNILSAWAEFIEKEPRGIVGYPPYWSGDCCLAQCECGSE